MARKKQQRKAAISQMEHVFESGDEIKGKWHKYFGNDHPIVVELGCGHGDYTIEMARQLPERNYVGVDIKGPRMWTGIETSLNEGFDHVAFARTDIKRLDQFFAPEEVGEIWITFPDPHPKPCRWKKRLSSAWFLSVYQRVLKPGGVIHLKTDDDDLYYFTFDTIAALDLPIQKRVDDVDAQGSGDPLLAIQTFYEAGHRAAGRTIHYVAFSLGSKTLDRAAIMRAAPQRQ